MDYEYHGHSFYQSDMLMIRICQEEKNFLNIVFICIVYSARSIIKPYVSCYTFPSKYEHQK